MIPNKDLKIGLVLKPLTNSTVSRVSSAINQEARDNNQNNHNNSSLDHALLLTMGAAASAISTEEEIAARELIEIVRTTRSGQAFEDAFGKLFDLAGTDRGKMALCAPSSGFVPILKSCLNHPDYDPKAWAVSVIGRLSASILENKLVLGSAELGLASEMKKAMTQEDMKDNAYVYFGNCVSCIPNNQYLLSDELGVLEVVYLELNKNPGYIKAYTLLANGASVMSNDRCASYIRYGFHRLALNKLKEQGPNPEKWADRNTGVPYRSLLFLTSFSTLPDGRKSLRDLNPKDYFVGLLQSGEKESMNAAMILSNLYGNEERNRGTTSSLLESYPKVFKLIVNFFVACMHYDSDLPEVIEYKNLGCAYGVLKLRDVTATFVSLSRSDTNKKIMLNHNSLMRYILEAMDLYIFNQPQCSAVYGDFQSRCGGGGEDHDTITNLLELIFQFSLFYELDRIQKDFNRPEYRLIERMNQLLDLPADRRSHFPYEARQSALQIVYRLTPQRSEPVAVLPAPSPSKSMPSSSVRRKAQHIMLSYAWGFRKENVVAFANHFRSLGYDVWRDEDGSSIVDPLAGDIVDKMAEAIQHSYAVVIFVSKAYKESANCQAEAKYARSRVPTQGLKLFFVMLDEQYHTRSMPEVVDGWLGFLIGTEMWYPLWDIYSQLDSTAQGIAEKIGDNALLSHGKNGSSSFSQLPPVSYSSSRLFSLFLLLNDNFSGSSGPDNSYSCPLIKSFHFNPSGSVSSRNEKLRTYVGNPTRSLEVYQSCGCNWAIK